MFKHLLLPTDGSALSERAVRHAMAMAKENGATVTGIHVIQPFDVFAYDVQMVENTDVGYMTQAQARAERYLGATDRAAMELGVPCTTVAVTDEWPCDAIIRTAQEKGCDLIVMASHGGSGMKAMSLGSVTKKVVAHSKLPVLVLR